MRTERRGSIAIEYVILMCLVVLWVGLRFDVPGKLMGEPATQATYGSAVASDGALR